MNEQQTEADSPCTKQGESDVGRRGRGIGAVWGEITGTMPRVSLTAAAEIRRQEGGETSYQLPQRAIVPVIAPFSSRPLLHCTNPPPCPAHT